ncbi:hypothetical protein CPAR01_06176, partial [Colletotrichum paranaense]
SSLKKSSPPHAVSSLYYSGLPPRASFPLYSLVGSSSVSPSRHGTPTLHLVKLLNSKSKPKPGTARTPPDLSNSQRPRVALVPNHTKTLFALSQPSSSLPNSPPLFPLARHPPLPLSASTSPNPDRHLRLLHRRTYLLQLEASP